MPEILRFFHRVTRVEERFTQEHVSGIGDTATFRNVSTGWWIVLDDRVAHSVGPGKPEFAEGDTIRVTMKRAP